MSDIAAEKPSQLIVAAERVIYAGAELQLTQLGIDLPDGDRIWWDTVRLLRTASVALVDADDRVLLLRRPRLIQGRLSWELPGGIVDAGEDPRVTALRELAELAGYRAAQLTLVQSLQPAPHSVDGERLLFVGREPEPAEGVAPDGCVREWVAPAEVLERIKTGQIWDSATLAALLGLLARAW
ncbi:MAG TPA: NUDIX domain-containing protein [Streptosporangiaceae bacterium]|nr:NUDIX domain-containing protein [Streptosporangiaceae bacterium]